MLQSFKKVAADSTCMCSCGLSAVPVHVSQRIAAAPAAVLVARAQLGADALLQPLRTAYHVR